MNFLFEKPFIEKLVRLLTIMSVILTHIYCYHVLDEDDDEEFYPGIWGGFDLTIDKIFKDEIDEVFNKLGIDYISTAYPKRYFDENYGG